MSLTLNYTKSEHLRWQKVCETIPLSEVKASRIWETAASNENTKIEETKFCSCFNLVSFAFCGYAFVWRGKIEIILFKQSD